MWHLFSENESWLCIYQKKKKKKKIIYVCIYFNGFELQWINLFI